MNIRTLGMGAIIAGGLMFGGACACTVDKGEALDRFKEIAGTEDVVIIRSTDLFDDSWGEEESYELLVNGRREGGQCIKRPFEPLVCRIYRGEE